MTVEPLGVFVGVGVAACVLVGVGLGPGVLVGGAGVLVRVAVAVAVGPGLPPLSCAPISNALPCGMALPKKSRDPILPTSTPALIAGEPDCKVNCVVGIPFP